MKTSIAFLLITFSALAQDEPKEYQIPYQELREASISYMESNCTKDKIKEFSDKLDERIAQKLEDNRNLQEDAAMRVIVLDWITDNREYLRKKEKTTIIQACFYFVRFIDKKYPLPSQFRQQLDEKTCNEIINYMKESDTKYVSNIEPDKNKIQK
jgi:hypothetical protein